MKFPVIWVEALILLAVLLAMSGDKEAEETCLVPSRTSEVIWELQTYRWDEFRGISRDRNDPKGTPVKKDDDFVDLCMTAALYPPPDFEMDYEYNPDDVLFRY